MSGDTYARAPGLWAWRILIARCGPSDPVMRACLWALATFLDEHGDGWATQEQVAAAASVSDRTVRDKLALASKMHWLGMKPKGAAGRNWKSYEFRACIPYDLEIPSRSCTDEFPEKVAELIDATESAFGDVGPEWLRGSHFAQPRPEGGSGHSAPKKGRDRKLTTHETGNSRQHDRKLAQPRPEGGSDTVSYSVSPCCSPEELVRSGDRTAAAVAENGKSNRRRKTNGPKRIAETLRSGDDAEPAPMRKTVTVSAEDRRRRIIELSAKFDAASIAKVAGMSADEVAEILREAAA